MQEKTGQLKLLFLVRDPEVAVQVIERTKKQFPGITVTYDLTDQASRALSVFREKRHHLLFLDAHLPGAAAKLVLLGVVKIDGSVLVAQLGGEPIDVAGLKPAVIKMPIVNWSEVLALVGQAIPEELKIRFGLGQADTVLLAKLKEYASKYRVVDPGSPRSEPIKIRNTQLDVPLATPAVASKKASADVKLPEPKPARFEFGVVAVLLVATFLAHWDKLNALSSIVERLQTPLEVITGMGLFGLLMGSLVRRYKI